ncbi:hypothetical protein L7F22_010484 [Adiantum nelumboides]|nr:hypothetical protein [Adiantum nelumboides]
MEHRRLVGEATNMMLNFAKDPKLAKYMTKIAFQDVHAQWKATTTALPKTNSKKQYSEKELEQEVEARLAQIFDAHKKGKKACGEYEAHEVRKLSAELLGRCNPNIILPLLKERLGHAAERHLFPEIKSYLFALCNMVLLRGETAIENPCMHVIQQLLSQILMWPCSPGDEDTYNVQHGCIDCFAWMIVGELASSHHKDDIAVEQHTSMQRRFAPKVIEEIETETIKHEEKIQSSLQNSVLFRVLSTISDRDQAIPFLSEECSWQPNRSEPAGQMLMKNELIIHTAFRVCMSNVLIRAAQQVAFKSRPRFLTQVIPHILGSFQVTPESHLRSAYLQLLFSVVHNFKEHVLSYAVDLFNLSLQIMRSKASSEERLAATRLLASLLSSADVVMNEVAPYLSEAMLTLESISRMDTSSDLRGLCEKLLACMMVSS